MATATVLPRAIPLTVHEAFSGVFGSISLASLIFLLIPQLIENYKQGSAEGVSLAFLLVWFVGDLTNLAGAAWAGLIPTIIAIAVYFCFTDVVLVGQCCYYNVVNARRRARMKRFGAGADGADGEAASRRTGSTASEDRPLLNRRNSDAIGRPRSHRRRSSAASKGRRESLTRAEEMRPLEKAPGWHEWAKNTLSILAICVIGAAGWAIAWATGIWVPPPVSEENAGTEMALGAQVLGYISAVCYLGARIPQIIKNQRERSCEGLSLLFFLLSVLGNATYGASILFHSVEAKYVLTNLPWLIGSLGTMAQDGIIFIQFHKFGDQASATNGPQASVLI